MSTAVKIALLLMFINVGIWVVGSMDWYTGGVAGQNPEGINPAENPAAFPGDWSVADLLTAGGFGALAGAAIAGLFGADPIRILGIGMFGGIFWTLWGNTADVLMNTMKVPNPFIMAFTLVYGVAFFLVAIQLMTGMSTETMT